MQQLPPKPDCSENTFCTCHPELPDKSGQVVEVLIVTYIRRFDKLNVTMDSSSANKKIVTKSGTFGTEELLNLPSN
ncbi:hypothetical protein D3C86_78830 [compost metagenome]